MATEVVQEYGFGPFRLDPENRLLLRDGQPVPLTPKAFDILHVLVENAGRLVLKDDLMKAVWPNTFITEANVTQTVFVLRKALGDTGGDQRYITTVAGKGYRFTADVRKLPPAKQDDRSTAALPASIPDAGRQEVGAHRWRRWLLAGLAAALGIVVLVVAAMNWRRPNPVPHATRSKLRVAVLPFTNLTADPGQENFIDGLTAELIVRLGNVDPAHLGVIARASEVGGDKALEQVQRSARNSNVDYMLEGSVRREAGRVRITATLVDTADDTHIWARDYDRLDNNPLALQTEIANEVADEIKLQLSAAPARSPRTVPLASPEAHDLYVKGLYYWNKRTAGGFARAIDFFQQAIAKDPKYAPAYAGLADSYTLISSYHLEGPPGEVIAKAREEALKALQLDPNSAQAHTSLGLIAENYDWDWQTAEKEFRRAIELDPNYVTAHHWYAELLGFEGRFDEALSESARARQLDPLSPIIATDDAAILYDQGNYDRAIEELRLVLDMEPDFPRANALLVQALVQKGEYKSALNTVDRIDRVDGDPWAWAAQAYTYARMGEPQQARRSLARFEAIEIKKKWSPLAMEAVVYAGMNDKDKAFACLEQAFKERSNELTVLKVDPAFASLRSDPRYQDLLRRVGLQN